MALCIGGAAPVALSSPHATPEDALQAVAEGDRLMSLRRFDQAIAAYSTAVDIDPTYALAYRQRSLAHLLGGSGERNSYVLTTTDPEARREVIADLERAFEHGATDDYLALVNQGANYFHTQDYKSSERFTRSALRLNPAPPLPWMNLGLVLAAQGRYEEARLAYHKAIDRLRERPDPLEHQEVFAASRGTLEILARQQPDRAASVRQLQGELVDAELADRFPGATIPSRTDADVIDLRLSTENSQLLATVSYRGLPEGAPLAWIVYFRPEAGEEWQQRQDLSVFEQSTLPPSGAAHLLIVDERCPAAGEYRLDLFLGRERLASGEASLPATEGRGRPSRLGQRHLALSP